MHHLFTNCTEFDCYALSFVALSLWHVCILFVCDFRWFHGKIDRNKADDLLNPRKDGLFLVRESKNFPGDYTLSVCCGNKVEHYRIIYSNNKLTIDEEGYFDNLTELVEVPLYASWWFLYTEQKKKCHNIQPKVSFI